MSKFAKGLQTVSFFQKRWLDRIAKRTHRTFDDRDAVLSEAIKQSERKDPSTFPTVQQVDAASLSVGGGTTTLTISGLNFEGTTEKATATTSGAAGELSFEATVPGKQEITVTITNTGDELAVTADAETKTVTVVHGDGGASNTAAIKAAIDAAASFLVQTTIETAGAIDADQNLTLTTSSSDPGSVPYVTYGDVVLDGSTSDFSVVSWSDTAIVLGVDLGEFAAGEAPVLNVWIDDVKALDWSAVLAA